MTSTKSISKQFQKSSNNLHLNRTYSRYSMSIFSSIGQKELCQWKSRKTDTNIQAKPYHQHMHSLQKFINQWKQLINEWDQNRDVLQCVYNHHTKFHVYPKPYEHFTLNLQTCVTWTCIIDQQRWKISIKLKMPHKNPEKFT